MAKIFFRDAAALLLLSLWTMSSVQIFAQQLDEVDLSNLSPRQRIIAYIQAADRLNIQSDTINLIYYYTSQAIVLLEKYPDKEQFAKAYYHLGRVSFQLGRFDIALSDTQNALDNTKNQETEYKILMLLAKIYEAKKAYPEVLNTLKKLEKFKQTDYVRVLLDQAQALTALNRFKSAATAAEEALILSRKTNRPDDILALVALGNIALADNHPQEALSFLKQAVSRAELIQISIYSAQAYFAIAKALQKLGSFSETIFYAQKALLSNSNQPLNTLDSEIYALLYDSFVATGETKQAINMLYLQYENDLNILEKRQQLNESFFDDSIKIQRLQNEISTLNHQKKQLMILLVILFIILLSLLVIIILVFNQFRQKDAHLHAALVAYNSLKNRTDFLQRGGVQNYLLTEKMHTPSHGILMGLIENYKDIKRQFGEIAVDYCCSQISQTLSDVIGEAQLIPHVGENYTFQLEWNAENYQDFCQHLERIPSAHFVQEVEWQKYYIKAKIKISAYYESGEEESKTMYRWKPIEQLTRKN